MPNPIPKFEVLNPPTCVLLVNRTDRKNVPKKPIQSVGKNNRTINVQDDDN